MQRAEKEESVPMRQQVRKRRDHPRLSPGEKESSASNSRGLLLPESSPLFSHHALLNFSTGTQECTEARTCKPQGFQEGPQNSWHMLVLRGKAGSCRSTIASQSQEPELEMGKQQGGELRKPESV